MSLKRNAEIPRPLTVWGLGGAPETPEQGGRGRTGDRTGGEETKITGEEAIYHLAGLQGSCSQPAGHECQELRVHRIGVQAPPSLAMSELLPKAKKQGQVLRTSNA